VLSFFFPPYPIGGEIEMKMRRCWVSLSGKMWSIREMHLQEVPLLVLEAPPDVGQQLAGQPRGQGGALQTAVCREMVGKGG
jgi:hypothetical protein